MKVTEVIARPGLVQRLRPRRRFVDRKFAAIEGLPAPTVGDMTNEKLLLAVPLRPDGEMAGCDTRVARARTAELALDANAGTHRAASQPRSIAFPPRPVAAMWHSALLLQRISDRHEACLPCR